jgi:hypothetical protein
MPSDHVKSIIDAHGGAWGEHSDLPVEDWQHEVANGDTRLGYWEWVAVQLDE